MSCPFASNFLELHDYLPLNDTLAYFFAQVQIRIGLDILHQNYFQLCKSEDLIEFMLMVNIDARALIGMTPFFLMIGKTLTMTFGPPYWEIVGP